MYYLYLGSKNEDELVSTVLKLGYPILTKNRSYNCYCNVVKIKHFQKISKNSIEIFFNFFGTSLVAPEYCIDKLEQNHIIP